MSRKKKKLTGAQIKYQYTGDIPCKPVHIVNYVTMPRPDPEGYVISMKRLNEVIARYCYYVNKGRNQYYKKKRFQRLVGLSKRYYSGREVRSRRNNEGHIKGVIRYFTFTPKLQMVIITRWEGNELPNNIDRNNLKLL